MFFNKDNPQWQLSEEQYLSREEHSRIVEEYDQLCKSMFSVDVRDINAKFYGVKEEGTPEETEETTPDADAEADTEEAPETEADPEEGEAA